MSLRSVEDVAVYLRRHGVSVGAKAFLCSKRSVADELLRFAKDGNANLIVAGAYGHSRLGEWMFGGVTRWPRASSAACSRTEAETGERFNNDGIAAKHQPGPISTPLDERSGGLYRFLGCAADQYMTRAVISVTGAVTMIELEALFERYDFNSFTVVEEGRILGIVTKLDFLRAFVFTTEQMVPHYDVLMRRRVADVMTRAVTHVEPTTPLTRVLELMVSSATRSLPVLSLEHDLVGIISREDVMRALRETTQCARSAASHPSAIP